MATLKRPISVRLADLLTDVIERRLDGVPVQLEVRAEPRVAGLARALALAVDNLIDNAVGATPPGGSVRVRLATDDRAAVVEVIDQGPGVPPALRQRLFEPFCTDRPEAAGLGLAATRAIVRAHGGSVEISDRPTTFRLRLPAA
jgi:signal transduction histidine kinase